MPPSLLRTKQAMKDDAYAYSTQTHNSSKHTAYSYPLKHLYMKQIHGIRDEAACMRVMPLLAVAPLAHGEDMQWNLNDDGINFTP